MTVDQQAFRNYTRSKGLGATTRSRTTTSTASRSSSSGARSRTPTTAASGGTSFPATSPGTSLPSSSPSSPTPSYNLPGSSPQLDLYNRTRQPSLTITSQPNPTIQLSTRNEQIQNFQSRRLEQVQQEYQLPATPSPAPSSSTPTNYPTLSPASPQTAGFDAGEFLKDNWEVAAAVVGLLVLTKMVTGKKTKK